MCSFNHEIILKIQKSMILRDISINHGASLYFLFSKKKKSDNLRFIT